MAKEVTGVKSLLKKLKTLRTNTIDNRTAKEIGRVVVKEMKASIKRGQSPIKGMGRFPSYKESYRNQIRRGTGRFRGKPLTPVNLRLTGQFLRSLVFKVFKTQRTGHGIQIGYLNSKLAQDKESGHRSGANKQKKRPTIPQGKEVFKSNIMKLILKKMRQRIRSITNR